MRTCFYGWLSVINYCALNLGKMESVKEEKEVSSLLNDSDITICPNYYYNV
jgi:hypothetical protein